MNSSSLMLILIVVLWLFVLAPLVVNTRKPIRRTSDALGKTRLLHRGGDELPNTRRRPAFSESDVRVSEEVDESLETVDAQIDDDFDVSDVLIDDTVDEVTEPAVVDGDIVYELESVHNRVDEVDDDAESQLAQVLAEDDNVIEPIDGSDSSKEDKVIRSDSPGSAAGETTVDVRRQFIDVDDMMFEAYAQDSDADSVDDADAAESPDSAVGTDSADQIDPAELAVDDDTLTEDDYAFAEKRRGRGGFDPISDARYAQTRFARRRRSVAGLAAFIFVTAVMAAFIGGSTWWIPLVGVGLMVIYLVNLRRTVRAEQQLRARRIRRMKMARLGVRHREDEELGIPQRLRRPGAVVVELDEENPDFADLAYTDAAFDDTDYDELPRARVS